MTDDDYTEMLEEIDESIESLKDKIANGRIRSPEHDRVRIKYHRALAYALRTRRQIKRDATLKELEERISELEERYG